MLVKISEQNLDSIQRVQWKAARIVCNDGGLLVHGGFVSMTLLRLECVQLLIGHW